MPKREKAKAAKALLRKEAGERTPISHEQLKAVDYPGAGMMEAFDETERTRAKGPGELPHGKLDIPLWLAYYDELYVLNKGTGSGLGSPREFLRKVAPHPKYESGGRRIRIERGEGKVRSQLLDSPLPVPSKERLKAARDRINAMAEEGGPSSLTSSEKNDWMPAWFNLDEAKKSFSPSVDTGKFQDWRSHISPVRLSPEEPSLAKEYSATVEAMTKRHPKK